MKRKKNSHHLETERIAVVIPAYNEEKRIQPVIGAAKKVKSVDEIVVVDDGSSDRTSEVAKLNKVKVIHRKVNGGKGAALKTGIENTDADIFVFIDADLVGLTPKHINDLIEPLLLDRKLMMTVGKFEGGRISTDLAQKIVPSISGQRALRKELLDGIPDFSKTGFGVERIITKHSRKKGAKVKEVMMSEATQVMKEEKIGWIKGFLARLKMYLEILGVRFLKKSN